MKRTFNKESEVKTSMLTLGDVESKYQGQLVCWSLFGCTGEWQQKVRTAFRQIGEAVMEEQGVGAEKASQLPTDTPLGSKAEEAYRSFCELLESD